MGEGHAPLASRRRGPDCVDCVNSGRDPDPSGGLAASVWKAVLVPPATISTPIHVRVNTDTDPDPCGGLLAVWIQHGERSILNRLQ